VQASEELKPLRVSYNYDSHITAMDCSPDGRYIVVGYSSDRIRVWDLVEGEELYDPSDSFENDRMMHILDNELFDYKEQITNIEFSPDGKYLLVSSSPNEYNFDDSCSSLIMYNTSDWTIINHEEIAVKDIKDVVFSPGGYIYITPYEAENTDGYTVALWNTEGNYLHFTLDFINSEPYSFAINPDETHLIISLEDKLVIVDSKNMEIIYIIYEPSVSDLQFSEDGRIFAAASNHQKTAIIWNTETGQELYRFKDFSAPPQSISLSSDGNYLVGTDTSNLLVWNLSSNKMILDTKIDDVDYLKCVSFSKDGKEIVVAAEVSSDFEDWRHSLDDKITRAEEAGVHYSQMHNLIPSGNGAIFIYNFQDIQDYGDVYKLFGLFTRTQLRTFGSYFYPINYPALVILILAFIIGKMKKG
jgi:WD40 repeat protein